MRRKVEMLVKVLVEMIVTVKMMDDVEVSQDVSTNVNNVDSIIEKDEEI